MSFTYRSVGDPICYESADGPQTGTLLAIGRVGMNGRVAVIQALREISRFGLYAGELRHVPVERIFPEAELGARAVAFKRVAALRAEAEKAAKDYGSEMEAA